MAYPDIYAAATDAAHSLRKQTAVALHKAAVDVLNESAATEDHAQRMAWARRVLADPVGWAAKAIWAVLESGKTDTLSIRSFGMILAAVGTLVVAVAAAIGGVVAAAMARQ